MILGHTEIKPYIDCIAIWKSYPEVEPFIDKFCEVETHELLHKVIIEQLRPEHEHIVSSLM